MRLPSQPDDRPDHVEDADHREGPAADARVEALVGQGRDLEMRGDEGGAGSRR